MLVGLADWLTAAGGYIGPVSIQEHAGVRGLVCTRDGVREGEPLLAVPRECTIQGFPAEGQRPIERLIIALLRARDEGSDGYFAPYIGSLPLEVPLLRDWDADQLTRLHAPTVVAEVEEQRKWLERLCAAQPAAPQADVRWAERLVRSRGIACADEVCGAGLQLVPLLDFANHRRHTADSSPAIVETGDGMTVLCASPAGKELRAGDEITFAYTCDEGNARLLLDYGFAQLGADEYVGLDELDRRLDLESKETAEQLWSW